LGKLSLQHTGKGGRVEVYGGIEVKRYKLYDIGYSIYKVNPIFALYHFSFAP
jgi:hypothetical protein